MVALYISRYNVRKCPKEAIVVMTDLIEKIRLGSNWRKSISIIDPNEVWIIEIIGKWEKEKKELFG